MSRLENIHALIVRLESAEARIPTGPLPMRADDILRLSPLAGHRLLSEARTLFAAELSRVIFSVQAEIADPATILSTPSNLRDAIGRALGADATDALGDDTLRGAARTLLS